MRENETSLRWFELGRDYDYDYHLAWLNIGHWIPFNVSLFTNTAERALSPLKQQQKSSSIAWITGDIKCYLMLTVLHRLNWQKGTPISLIQCSHTHIAHRTHTLNAQVNDEICFVRILIGTQSDHAAIIIFWASNSVRLKDLRHIKYHIIWYYIERENAIASSQK